MISKYLPFIIASLLILLISSAVLNFKQKEQIDAALEIVQQKDEIIKKLEESYNKANSDFIEMARLNKEIYSRYSVVLDALEKNKGREKIVEQKPELVEKLIQRSYNEFEKDFSCITGNQSRC